MEPQEQVTTSPDSNKSRLTNQQLEYLKRVVEQNGDIEWINAELKVRSRTLSRWLKDPAFVERLSDLPRRMVWNSIFEAARLLPTSINILYRHMTSKDPNVAVKASIEGIKLFSSLVDKEKGCVKFTDTSCYLPKKRENRTRCVKTANHASSDVVKSRPKKRKPLLLPEKTGYAAEIRSIFKRDVAAIVKIEEKEDLIHPIVNRFPDSIKPLNIQYGPPSTDTKESA
jgi:hypothetical protein